VPFNAQRAQMWSDRAVAIIEATRHSELLPRGYDDSDGLALQSLSAQGSMLGASMTPEIKSRIGNLIRRLGATSRCAAEMAANAATNRRTQDHPTRRFEAKSHSSSPRSCPGDGEAPLIHRPPALRQS
jgi:hypothetical protein